MNVQDIITPIGKFIQRTFETVLVPPSNPCQPGGHPARRGRHRLPGSASSAKYTAAARQHGDII